MDDEKLERTAQLSRFLPSSPFRYPDWRWQLSKYYLERKQSKNFKDPITNNVFHFCKKIYEFIESEDQDFKFLEKLAKKNPDLFFAWQIHTSDEFNGLKIEIQSRILGREEISQACAKVGIAADIYQKYNLVFFDVTDRLDNASFIIWHVIFPDSYIDFRDEFKLLKFLGYFLGPAAIDYYVYRIKKQLFSKESEITSKLLEESREFLKLRYWSLVNTNQNTEENINALRKFAEILKTTELPINLENDALGTIYGEVKWQVASPNISDKNLATLNDGE